MQLSHSRPVASAVFDDPNLVSCAGLVPMVALTGQCGLAVLADEHLSVPTDKGANAGAKVTALVAGMIAGADSIDDMALLRHGAMATVFDRPYAPSTLGSFLREFAFGHVRQLDAVASRLLGRLHERTPLLAGIDGPVIIDLDDTIIEVHGYAKQGSGYGYSGVRGLNALIATLTTAGAAPVIAGQRLRKGACGSARGAARIIADTLATVARLRSAEATGKPLVRMDSAFYGYPSIAAAMRGGADISVTVRLDPKVKAAIADIDDDAWTAIEYTDAVYDDFPDALSDFSGTTIDRSGQRFLYTPKLQTFLGVQYSLPAPGLEGGSMSGWLTPRLEWAYVSSIEWIGPEVPAGTAPGYNLLNARLSYERVQDTDGKGNRHAVHTGQKIGYCAEIGGGIFAAVPQKSSAHGGKIR